MMVLGKFYSFEEKISQAQEAQKATLFMDVFMRTKSTKSIKR